MMRRLRAGFTLIELLVVIAIISVLASMLLPAISMVRRSASTVGCASGMRQVMVGMLTYSADQSDLLPMVQGSPAYGSQWLMTLSSYLDATTGSGAPTVLTMPTTSVFFACKEKKLYSIISPSTGLTMWRAWVVSGMGMNIYPGMSPSAPGISTFGYNWRLSQVTEQSTRACLGDSNYYYLTVFAPGPYGFATPTFADWVSLRWKYRDGDPERHFGKMNMAFYDGHVQVVPAGKAYNALYDPANFR